MADPVFDRVRVDFLIRGNARVAWEMSTHFHAPEPWSFQLQVAESDLTQGNWVDVGAPVINTFFAIDTTRRAYGKELNVFYRIVLTDANTVVYTSQAAEVMGNLDFKTWHYAQEIIRKERLRLKALKVGIEGYLLKIKRSGTPCPDCLDQFTAEVTNSNCQTCFGSRWTGGYYDPEPLVFGDLTAADDYLQRETESGLGMVNPQIVRGMFVGQPYLSTMDIWVNRSSDERYHLHNITTRTQVRGVPLLVVADMRPVPYDNVVYTIEVERDLPPDPFLPC